MARNVVMKQPLFGCVFLAGYWLVLLTLIGLAAGGCRYWPPLTDPSLFRAQRFNPDGRLLVRGRSEAEFKVSLYGVEIQQDQLDNLEKFNERYVAGRLFLFANGASDIVERNGRLVYDKPYAPTSDVFASAKIVESDGITPKQDENGNPLVIAVVLVHPPLCIQELLVIKGIATPDLQIQDRFVSHLLRKTPKKL